ncbi:hypothetical protein BCR33DRAFT_736433 [Rhizoclosmatium globosum]|uniref:THO complex subunit 2 n=1 Tax=Rhizoclosmatium globosum TaxID=329046 RepID=A0A1Y2CJ57_9FUNG|nr:hypothetical protein BCR33DRAFT_736433 [Rhizoclosmatium globosum]|eukprot:ORY46937.1 hypothetical protein BCR33DRAFT_736433 [Rhizoclosmatium globosum]
MGGLKSFLKMKIVVFGGSGEHTTGSQFVRHALAEGHEVTVLVRSRSRFTVAEQDRLTIELGDATSAEDVERVLSRDTQVVVCSLGANSLQFTDVCSVATGHIVAGMKSKCPTARLLAVTSLGVGDSFRDIGFWYGLVIWIMLGKVLVDKNTQEQIIFMQSGWLDWVIARPAGLGKGDLTKVYNVSRYSTGGRISRNDVAHFLLSNITGDTYKHQPVSPAFAASFAHQVFKLSQGSKFIEQLKTEDVAAFVGPTSPEDPLLVPSLLVDCLFVLDVKHQPISAELFEWSNVNETSSARANLIEYTLKLIALGFIPELLLLERLDPEFLEQVRLLGSAKLFQRKVVRVNTNITYKQQKFNLLREESEGFAMLETYLSGNLPPSYQVFWNTHHLDSVTRAVLSHKEVQELHVAHRNAKVVSVLENINSLIGYFDLNPNKVLDLILDVFIANVVDHWDFFVELLLQSHWKPVMSKTGTLEGSPVLGQILGFKFDYYNNDATKTVTPPQLIWITAILIKHKLVQLEDVYPHLSPADEDMDQELQAFKDKLNLQKKQGGKYKDTTLADAGALSGGSSSEDSGPAIQFKERGSTSTVSERNSTPQPPTSDPTPAVTSQPAAPPKPRKTNQKAVLASYLLALGSINSARLLLDRIPLLVQIHPEISDYIHRTHLFNTSSHPLVITPLPATQPPPMNTLNYKIAQAGVRVGRGGKLNYPKLKFFYDTWADGLPSCATFDDVVKVLRVLLPYVCVSGDVVFVSKVARIGRAHVLAICLYGEWKHKTYAAIPQLGVAKAACVSDAKYTMRRLSKETVKRFGRYIGKIGHSNPTIAFHYILELLQTYENQNATVVEGSKYMSELSFDVVTFTLIEQLGNEQKERIQPGGIGVKTIFKKHAIELGGILRYLFAQLVKGNMFDMIILQEIVMQMCGIKAILDDVTSDQFNALAAGETLRREAFGNEPVRVVKKVSGRLLKALMETELVLPFAVLIGQHITGSVFVQGVGEIKILGWMLDNAITTENRYRFERHSRSIWTFVTSNCDREVYSNLVPDIDVLRNEYGLSPEVAFAILRPKLDYLVKTTPLPVSNTASAMDLDQKEKAVNIHPALLPVVESVKKTLPESVWSILSPHFYVTFWSLTLYDIDFPKQKYLSEITKLKSTIDGLNADKSNSGGNTPAKRRKDIAKHRETIGLLEKEMSVHETHVKKVLERLQRESAGWFGFGDAKTLSNLGVLIMQHCIVPRSLFSPADALFGAKFLFLAQSFAVPNLMMLPFFDKLLHKNTLQSMIYLCTEMEARNYGRFLQQCHSTFNYWYNSPKAYNDACLSETRPGFAMRWNPDPVTGQIPFADLMKHSDFIKIMFKWHAQLHTTITRCMESSDYAQITNSIIVLDKVQDYFPKLKEHAQTLETSVQSVIAKETERKDLKLIGNDRDRDGRGDRDRERERDRNRLPERPGDSRRDDRRADDRGGRSDTRDRVDGRDRANPPRDSMTDSPRKQPPATTRVDSSSPGKSRDERRDRDDRDRRGNDDAKRNEDKRGSDDRKGGDRDGRGDSKDTSASRSDKDRQPNVSRSDSQPTLPSAPVNSSTPETAPVIVQAPPTAAPAPVPVLPPKPDDPLTKLREKLLSTRHPHHTPSANANTGGKSTEPSVAQTSSTVPVGPERPPPTSEQPRSQAAIEESKPKLSIVERLGPSSAAAVAASSDSDKRSNSSDRRNDRNDRNDRNNDGRKDRDRDRDRDRSDRNRDKDRDRKDRKSGRSERDDSTEDKRKRDRSDAPVVVDRDSKRVKVEDGDIPKSVDAPRKRDVDDGAANSTPPPPPVIPVDSLDQDRNKRVKLNRNFGSSDSVASNGGQNNSGGGSSNAVIVERNRGNIVGAGGGIAVQERQTSQEGGNNAGGNQERGGHNSDRGGRDRRDDDRGGNRNYNRYNDRSGGKWGEVEETVEKVTARLIRVTY